VGGAAAGGAAAAGAAAAVGGAAPGGAEVGGAAAGGAEVGGAAAGAPFRYRLRVRYAECDRQGHVFNSHYFAYFDVAMTELWRAAIGNYDLMVERGVDVVVGEAQARFRRAARFDDEIDVEAAIERLGRSGITIAFRVLRGSEPLVDGRLMYVCVDARELTSTPIPGWLREALAPWVVSR
jgi:acyl-CoA thioester hydrolase